MNFLREKIFLGNMPNLFVYLLLLPIVLIMKPVFALIGWLCLPNNQKFCRHKWVARKLEATYGVFGGMEVYKCEKCLMEDWNRNAEKRLKGSGLIP